MSYDPATGNEWLELTNSSPYYSVDVDGWTISDGDGNTYSIPSSLDPMPQSGKCPDGSGQDEARIIIVFGSGTNETNWNDCVVTLYTGSSTAWFENDLDDVGLGSEAGVAVGPGLPAGVGVEGAEVELLVDEEELPVGERR